MKEDELGMMTPKEVSKEFKISRSTLTYYVKNNYIPYVRMGKRNVRFLRSDLMKWIEGRKNLPYEKEGD